MDDNLKCSFCGTGADKLEQLVAGPDVAICNNCIDLCAVILAEGRGKKARDKLLANELADILRYGT